jgi:hypothetical protein
MLLPILSALSSLLFIAPASAEDGSVDSAVSSFADHVEGHAHHVGHSDALMILIGHKIALQKLQRSAQGSIKSPDQSSDQKLNQNFSQQSKIFKQVMPVLSSYMSTPKSYYLTTQMYHDSLENRAAMLADFTALLAEYQKQLVSLP